MIGINRLGALLVAAALFAACTPNESGNIPCNDTNNCPGAYPTCSSRGFCVEAAPLNRLEMVAGDAQSAASGTALTQALTVRALDTNGNAVPNVAVTWTASGSATLSATSTTTGPDGKSQVTATLGKTNGTYTYSASAAGVSSAPVAFTATGVSGPAAKISGDSGNDQTTVVGTTLGAPLKVKVADINDNPVAGVAVTWAMSAGGGNVAQGSAVTGADGIASTTATVGTIVTANTFTASASNGAAPLTGSPVTFHASSIADVAASIVVAGFPNPASAGTQGFVFLTAKDQYGNTASGYRGTVHVTTDNPGATLPPDYTFTASDSGSKSLPVTLNTSSSVSTPTFSITATDTVTASINGTLSNLTVNPAPASTLVVVAAPSTRVAGVALTSLTVTAKDTFGNTVNTYTGTVHFTSTDPQAVLPADTTLVNGTRSFTGVVLKTVGAQTITARDTVTTTLTGTSNAVTVTPAAASTLQVVPAGTSQVAGVAFDINITAKDAFGNIATTYAGTLHFTSTDGQAVLPANSGLTSGTGTFPITFKTAGTQSVTATDTVNAGLSASTGAITVAPAATSKFLVQATTPQTAGQPFTVTVTAQDPFNNTTPGYTGFVKITSTDPAATLPPQAQLTSGIKLFSVTLNTPGTWTVTATDSVTAAITGVSPAITVNPGPTSTLVVTAGSPQVSGNAFTLSVVAKDSLGNTTPAYTGTVHFTSTDAAVSPGNGLPANYTFTALDAGSHNFSVTLKTPGTWTVTATDTVTGSITGTTSNIVVNPGPTTQLLIKGTSATVAFPTGVVQGLANTVTVVAMDANNNVTPAYTGTISFTSNNGSPTLPADYTFTALDAGVHTFVGGVTFGTLATGTTTLAVTDVANAIFKQLSGITVAAPPLLFQGAAARIVGGSRDGQIFITGGSTTNDNTNTTTATTRTYFYNPANGALVLGPALNTARRAHTATATVNGQVVIAGGDFSGSNADGEFELCSTDGATPACTSVNGSSARRNAARCNAAAALVTTTPSVRVIIAGGDSCVSTTAFTSWDIWDSASPLITTTSGAGQALTTGRRLFTASALPNGKVLFAGGASTATADLFTNAATLSSATMGATTGGMSAVRSGHTASVLNAGVTTACPTSGATCVLIAGGTATAGKTWEIYDSGTNSFPRGPAAAANDLLIPGRNQHAAAVFANGKVLLAGGNDGAGNLLKSSESFDPAAATLGFTAGSDFVSGLTRNHPGFAYAPAQDLLIVVGGNTTAPAVDQLIAP